MTVLCLAIVLSAKSVGHSPAPIYKDSHQPVERRIQDLLSRMTVLEMARQLDMYSGVTLVDKRDDDSHASPTAVPNVSELKKLLGNSGVGSIHDLNAPDARITNALQRWVIQNSRLGIPALFIEEGLHGSLAYNRTVFPAPINLSATWNRAMAQRTGGAIAAELRAAGNAMLLGPVLDLAREPRWGRIEEDFGEDPFLTGQLGLHFVKGAQGDSLASDHTVVAEPKHFAAHGSPESGTNTSPVHIGERELRMTMLRAFEPAFREGHAMGSMSAYHQIDGIPCTANPLLQTQILRNEWGFKGFVLSDLGAIRELTNVHYLVKTPKEAVAKALAAGVNMQFYDFKHPVFEKAITEGYGDGTISKVALRKAVAAVLRVKFDLGLFDHPYVDESLNAKVQHSEAHQALALESARQSMTLLKNDGGLLPLSKTLQRVAVIGNNADEAQLGDYSDGVKDKKFTMLQGIREFLPSATVLYDDGKVILTALEKAKASDVVILGLGEWHGTSGEGSDRSDLNLPGQQEALLEAVVATGKPVVLVLQNGRPLTIGWAKAHVPAILEAWYPGEWGGRAIAQTLFGDNNPAGRLTVSFPESIGHLPSYYNHGKSKYFRYVEGTIKPLFPFGFGLSYTTFKYSKLKTTAPTSDKKFLTVSFDVTNSGDREGDEVAQVYVRQDFGSVETPDRELKGFERVHLKPRETKRLQINIAIHDLEVWAADEKWRLEPGDFTVWVGGSSDANLESKVAIGPVSTGR